MSYTNGLDDPTIFFNTILYSGTGSDQSVTGTGFTTDWLWIKERNGTDYHFVNDSVRGKGSNNHYLNLHTNATNAESDQTTGVNAINSNGFDITYRGELNESGKNYVAWNWKAGGSASSNTDGDETTSVSVNQTAGFSIVSYTGTGSVDTFGHGLGAKPNLMLQKKRSGSAAWTVYHDKVDANPSHKYLYLNSTAALADYADHFNDTEPTSSVFTLGTDTSVNGSSATNIMYCFTEKKGYSKFGTYQGNGNADGTFIYTGFLPAWIAVKPIDATQNWQIHDLKRLGYNVKNYNLSSNSTAAEAENDFMDILSNGFKIRRADVLNVSGDRYIYWCFAESPLVNSKGVPNNAR